VTCTVKGILSDLVSHFKKPHFKILLDAFETTFSC